MNNRCPECGSNETTRLDVEPQIETFENNSLETLVHYLGAVALKAPEALAKLWKIL